MRKLLFALVCTLVISGSAAAQTTTFNGIVKDLTLTPVPTGQVSFQLRPGIDTTIGGNARFTSTSVFCEIHNPSVVSTSGTGTITVVVGTAQNWQVGDSLIFVGTADATLNANTVATPYTITLVNSTTSFNFTQSGTHTNGAGGTVGGLYKSGGTGACAITQNTAITPANTSYNVGLWPLFSLTGSFNTYAIGSGPVDISTIVPTPGQQPSYSFVDVFTNQSVNATKTFNGSGAGLVGASGASFGGTWAGNPTFSGNPLFSGSPSFSGPTTFNAALNGLGGGSFTGTFSHAGQENFSKSLLIADLTENTAATHFGDSITQCVNLGSGPNQPTQSSQCYWSILDAEKNWTSTNSGLSGSGITDVGQMDSILGTTVAGNSVSTELCCVNDMRNNGAGGIAGAAQQVDWASSLEAAMLWLAVPDANKVKASGSSVTYTGTWTTPSQSYGGLTRQTTTAGNTASFNVYGTSVYIVTLWQTVNTSTYTINVDGTVYPTISTSTGSYTTIQGRQFGPLVTRLSGLPEALHGVIITCTAADGSDPCYFVFAAGGTGQASNVGPYVFLGNTLQFTSGGYSGSGGSAVIVGQFNQRIAQVAADLSSDGLHVQVVDVSGYYTPNGTNTQSDGIHPTIIGHTILAQAFENEMAGYLTPNDRASLRILRNVNACTNGTATGGGWFVGGCQTSGPTRGDIGAARSAISGAYFFGLDGSGIVRNNNIYTFTATAGQPQILLGSQIVATPTLTLKSGSGGGAYTGTNTALAAVDTTNLCTSVTVPTGWKLLVSASGVGQQNTAAAGVSIALADAGATCTSGGITALNGSQRDFVPPAITTNDQPFHTQYILVGDGSAHSVALVAKTANASDAWVIVNSSAVSAPSMTYILTPSN